MNSSTSSSDGVDRWRGFFWWLVGTATAAGLLIYGFIAIVDPFNILAFSPPFERVPVATNARFSHPALAREPRFDSAVFGTSTSRLLRPAVLDRLFHARFANLAMNDAQAYEQYRLLEVFARHHHTPLTVMIGLDAKWCETGEALVKYTPRPFPEWMYEDTAPLRGYLEMFSLYVLTQAIQEFRVLIGVKQQRYGSDGYENFLPDDSLYDAARARTHLVASDAASEPAPPASEFAALKFPAHPLLAQGLCRLPRETQKLLFFAPYHISLQGEPGSRQAAGWQECKNRIARLASGMPNTTIVDFMIPSPITREATHYWDQLHYREAVAERVAQDLAAAARGQSSPAGDYRLVPAAGTESAGGHDQCRGS